MNKPELVMMMGFMILVLVVFAESKTQRNGYDYVIDYSGAEMKVGNIIVSGPIQLGSCILENETLQEGSVCYDVRTKKMCVFNGTGVTCA